MVHPRTQISNPLTKYQWLTKSVVVSDLPEQILSMEPIDEPVLNDFKERATDFLAFQIRDKPRQPLPVRDLAGFFMSSLSSLWSLGHRYTHLVTSHMTFDPKIECYWRRNGNNFYSTSTPLYIMHTTNALGLFCKPDYEGESIPPVHYTPLHLSVFEHTFDQILPFGGARRFSPCPIAHTLFIIDRKSRTLEQLHAHGLMQLFTQAAAEAVQNGFKIDEQLPYPLVNQGIITDGQQFTFVCFQLNTLDFHMESEGKNSNVFWAGPSMKLFEGINFGENVQAFNDECSSLILKFLLHEPQRKRLRAWGEGWSAMPLRKMATDGHKLSPVRELQTE